MRLNPSTKEAYNKMADLGLITYNAQAGFDFLVKNGVTPASRSVGDIEVALEKYVMQTEGVTKWNDKCDTTFRELATSSAFLSSKFYDQQGKIQSLEHISGILKESMKDLTDQQRSMALETLFGSDAVRGATILFNEGSQGVNKMYTEMSKVTALETANTKMNTLKGRIEQLSGAFDTMKKTIGDALAPVVSAFVAGLQKLVDGFNSLPGPVQKAVAITGGIVLALTAIATVIGRSSSCWNGGFRDWCFRGCIRNVSNIFRNSRWSRRFVGRSIGTRSNCFRCGSGRCWCWGISI